MSDTPWMIIMGILNVEMDLNFELHAPVPKNMTIPLFQKRAMMATWFNFRDKSDPFDYVVNLSDVMHVCLPLISLTQGKDAVHSFYVV